MSDQIIMAAVIVTGILLGLLVVVGLPVSLGLRHAARERELEHTERMKALELGRPWPGETAARHASASSKAVTLGVWVPLGALGIALAATSGPGGFRHDATFVWLAAGAVGLSGVVCGTMLALRESASGVSPPPPVNAVKGALDADALDVVSRRG
jgi:hypothetical protein